MPTKTPAKTKPAAKQEPSEQEPPKSAAKQEPFRPSGIPDNVGDRQKWLRENGKPNPVRLYRVTGRGGKGKKDVAAFECDAVDETEAINKFVAARKIKETNRYKFRVVMLKE